jgi:hypothetical protein
VCEDTHGHFSLPEQRELLQLVHDVEVGMVENQMLHWTIVPRVEHLSVDMEEYIELLPIVQDNAGARALGERNNKAPIHKRPMVLRVRLHGLLVAASFGNSRHTGDVLITARQIEQPKLTGREI